jgi:hypothetical protein
VPSYKNPPWNTIELPTAVSNSERQPIKELVSEFFPNR